jgi:plasmid stabilization system protein ParE
MALYELTREADEDLAGIVAYTLDEHGPTQVRQYMRDLEACIKRLAAGKLPYKVIDAAYPGMRVRHCQSHYIFALMRKGAPMMVVAVFHERMDVLAQLRNRLG